MSRSRSIGFWPIKLAIAGGLLFWLYRSDAVSFAGMGGLLVNWPLLVVAGVLFLLSGLLSAWRLCMLLWSLGHQLRLMDSVRLTFIGLFFNVCLPGGAGGDATRLYYASFGNPGWRTELGTVLLLDRMAGLFALFLWPVLAAPFFPDLLAQSSVIRYLIVAAAIATVVMLAGLVLVMTDVFRQNRLLAWMSRRMPMGHVLAGMVETLHGYRRSRMALVSSAVVSLAIHTLAIGVTLVAAVAIDPGHFSWRIALLAPLGFLANALPVTPGGLGVGEAAFASLFRMAGLPGGPPVMLAWRVVSLMGSVAGVVFYLQEKRRLVHAPSMEMYQKQTS